jgi:hypothetical protein
MNYDSKAEINLLWTGGWDSTFRLLDLILIQKSTVQPFYIIDTGRPSTLNELKAMNSIREDIAKRNSQLANLIKPTVIVSIHDIKANYDVTTKFNRLKEKGHLGQQYEWLASFANQWNIPNLELCIHIDDYAYKFISEYLLAIRKTKQLDRNNDASIFSFFNFPLLKLSKVEMMKIAQEQGFSDIMEKTWFCHTPWRNKPCGICVPCNCTIKEGLGYRVPKLSRLRRKLWIFRKYLSDAAKRKKPYHQKKTKIS